MYFLKQSAKRKLSPILTTFFGEYDPFTPPTLKLIKAECVLYFVHNFMRDVQLTIKILENNSTTASELYSILYSFNDSMLNRIKNSFYGLKVRTFFKLLPDNEVLILKTTFNNF